LHGGRLVFGGGSRIAVQEIHAVMEGTGVYHETAALVLTDAGVTVSYQPEQKEFIRPIAQAIMT
jgi:hypothetical protein